jgi:hypothetical protein
VTLEELVKPEVNWTPLGDVASESSPASSLSYTLVKEAAYDFDGDASSTIKQFHFTVNY